MAHINVYDYIAIGLDMTGHTGTSYQVALDPEFENIIDQSINNTQDLLYWNTPLPMPVVDGEKPRFYKDVRNLYSRIKLHFGNHTSPWWELSKEDQKVQDVVMTQKNKKPVFTNSKDLGWEVDTTSEIARLNSLEYLNNTPISYNAGLPDSSTLVHGQTIPTTTRNGVLPGVTYIPVDEKEITDETDIN